MPKKPAALTGGFFLRFNFSNPQDKKTEKDSFYI